MKIGIFLIRFFILFFVVNGIVSLRAASSFDSADNKGIGGAGSLPIVPESVWEVPVIFFEAATETTPLYKMGAMVKIKSYSDLVRFHKGLQEVHSSKPLKNGYFSTYHMLCLRVSFSYYDDVFLLGKMSLSEELLGIKCRNRCPKKIVVYVVDLFKNKDNVLSLCSTHGMKVITPLMIGSRFDKALELD